MKRISLFASAVLATTFVVASPSIYASPLAIGSPIHAMFAHNKNVQISFRNDSTSTLELKVGDNVMSLPAGKTMSLKVPEGTRVITNTPTKNHEAGSLIVQVTTDLSGATVAIS
jgi:hypothetical protein